MEDLRLLEQVLPECLTSPDMKESKAYIELIFAMVHVRFSQGWLESSRKPLHTGRKVNARELKCEEQELDSEQDERSDDDDQEQEDFDQENESEDDEMKSDEEQGMDDTTNQFDDDADARLEEPTKTATGIVQGEAFSRKDKDKGESLRKDQTARVKEKKAKQRWDDVADFTIALRMFTRSLVIQKRVEDLQLRVDARYVRNYTSSVMVRLTKFFLRSDDITKILLTMGVLGRRRRLEQFWEKKRAHFNDQGHQQAAKGKGRMMMSYLRICKEYLKMVMEQKIGLASFCASLRDKNQCASCVRNLEQIPAFDFFCDFFGITILAIEVLWEWRGTCQMDVISWGVSRVDDGVLQGKYGSKTGCWFWYWRECWGNGKGYIQVWVVTERG
ncbi:hypothetical protein Tco_0251584 [Tanacetum coccineum]